MGFFARLREKKARAKKLKAIDRRVFVQKDDTGRDIFSFEYTDPEGKFITILLKHIYTCKEGRKYFQFVNPLQMTMERNIAVSMANKEFLYNMTVEELNVMCDQILVANNSRDYNTVALKANEIKVRSLKLVESETTLKLGAIMFLSEDEHPGRYNPIHTQSKIDLWKADDEARGFFLQFVWDIIKPYTELSSKDLMDYLTATTHSNKARKAIGSSPSKVQAQEAGTKSSPNTGKYNTLT